MIRQHGKKVYEYPDELSPWVTEVFNAIQDAYVADSVNSKFEEVVNHVNKDVKLYKPPIDHNFISNNL